MSTVEFYRLTKKFVDSEHSIPEKTHDVLYYALEAGHHVGVIDCFERALVIELPAYEHIVQHMDNEEVRRKLWGVKRYGEIEINKSHVGSLLPCARAAYAALDVYNEEGKSTLELKLEEINSLVSFIELLVSVRDEPSNYLTVRLAS